MAPPKAQQSISANATGSRSRSACYACRARKQKCDGNRGPAKGYIEALETRLKETERVVWRFLTVSTEENLSAAFSAELQEQLPASLSISTLGTTEEKKSAIAFWEQFPFHALDDVLAWKEEIDSPSVGGEGGAGAGHYTRDRHPDSLSHTEESPSEGHEEAPLPPPLTAMDVDEGTAPQSAYPGHHQPSTLPEPIRQASTVTPPFLPPTPGTLEGPPMPMQGHLNSAPQPSRTAATRNKFGLSKEFQDTFLW